MTTKGRRYPAKYRPRTLDALGLSPRGLRCR